MVTKEELMQYKPPEQTIIDLNELSTETGLSMEKTKEIFYTVFTQDILNPFTDLDERARQAAGIMKAQVADIITSKPLCFYNFFEIKSKSCYINLDKVKCIDVSNRQSAKINFIDSTELVINDAPADAIELENYLRFGKHTIEEVMD